MDKVLDVFRIFFVVLFLVQLVRTDELQCPDNYNSTTTMKKLLQSVFCSYDREIRPVRQHGDIVDVEMKLVVKSIEFDERRDKAKIYSYFVMKWTDYHILWDPSKFDNIRELHVPNYAIWMPDITVFHSADCDADLTRWPYDTHTCILCLGSWTHTGELVNVSLMEPSVYFQDYKANREWELMSLTSYKEIAKYPCCPNDTFPSVTFKLLLRRHSGSFTAIVVVPTVVLMLLTLVTFWMKTDQPHRLILVSAVLLSHFFYLQYLGQILPSNGNSTPLLVTFYRDSMFLTLTALFTTLIVQGLQISSISLPLWVSGLSSWVVQNRVGQMIVFRNLDPKGPASVSEASRGEDTDQIVSLTSDWNTFTSIFNFTAFMLTLLTYLILLFKFIP